MLPSVRGAKLGDYHILIAGAFLCGLTTCIAWTDARQQIIPDPLNAVLALTGVVQLLVLGSPEPIDALWAAAGGFCALWLLRALYVRFRGYQGLGLGDVKFVGAAGLWIGVSGLPWLLLFAALSGLTWVVARGIWSGQMDAKQRLSFGPHLCLGLFATWSALQLGLL